MKHKKLLRKLLFIFIGAIVFIMLMDQVIMPWYTKHGDEYEMPDVTEQPVPEAVDLLESEGFMTPIMRLALWCGKVRCPIRWLKKGGAFIWW